MAFILTVDQEVPITVAFADEHGNMATVDGIPVWSSSDDMVAMVVTDDTGLTAVVSAVGPLGTAQISVTADARMGADVVPVIGLLDFEIVAGEAVRAVLSAGEARPKAAMPMPPVIEPEPPVVEPEPPVVVEPEPPVVVEPEPPVDPNAPHPDNTLPTDQPHPDNTLPTP